MTNKKYSNCLHHCGDDVSGRTSTLFLPSSNVAFRCPQFLLLADIWDDNFFPEFPESRKHWQSKLGLA